MTIFLLANSTFIVVSMTYGWLAGDRHDREGVAWMAAAIIGTAWAQSAADALSQVMVIGVVDTALLIAMVSLALRSTRYWPTWFAGLQLATVAINLTSLAEPGLGALRTIGAFFGTLAILVMVLGIFLDRLAADKAKPAAGASRAEN